ncbi:GNAT family N-acetyltransferase [Metallococcus carri]|uniref:GNAT family N-acetyltransferase n=1 Tax=Metallococcus carri TaxID=1656884 RepID=UPI002E2CD748|nr:GNAT family N-acetyltransferase [Metallococcus carri]
MAEPLHLRDRTLQIDRATRADLPQLVALLADDEIGRDREGAQLAAYERAFERIDADPAHLLVAVRDDDSVVGTMQLTLLPGLSRSATTRLQIEGVRVAASQRGSGLGAAMFAWAADWGRAHGAGLAQLTTDKRRGDAHRFYERLGWSATHEGYKRGL